MSIWATATSASVETALGVLADQHHQHTASGHRQSVTSKSSIKSLTNHSSPGSLTNFYQQQIVNQSPSGGNASSSVYSTATTHSNNNSNALHIGVALGAVSQIAATIASSGGSNINNNNNNSNSNASTYPQHHRNSLSQSQILSYTPPNPNKVSVLCVLIFLHKVISSISRSITPKIKAEACVHENVYLINIFI